MEYNKEKRTLSISSGFVKRISSGECYKTDLMYLGIFDSAKDYVEITEEEYNSYLGAILALAEQQESGRE